MQFIDQSENGFDTFYFPHSVCVSARACVCMYVDLSAAYNRQLKVMMMNSLHIHQMASALDQRKELTQMNTQCTYTCIECI